MERLKVIELFAGMVAQREGLNRANVDYKVVAILGIDKYALKTYELQHGDVPNLKDWYSLYNSF